MLCKLNYVNDGIFNGNVFELSDISKFTKGVSELFIPPISSLEIHQDTLLKLLSYLYQL